MSNKDILSPASRLVRIGFQSGSGDGDTSKAAAAVSLNAPGVEASLEFEFLHPGGTTHGSSSNQEDKANPAASEERVTEAGDQDDAPKPAASEERVTETGDQDNAPKPAATKEQVTDAGDQDDVPKPAASEERVTETGDQDDAPKPAATREQVTETCDKNSDFVEDTDATPERAKGEDKSEPKASQLAAQKVRRRDPKPSEAESVDSNSPNRPTKRGFRILGVEFAPLNTPMRRRLQTLAVLQWLLSIALLPTLCALLLLILLFTPLAPLVLAYMGWVLVFDRKTSQRGGRRWERVRRWSLWKHYRDYFPISLVKSAELDPKHNYLIGYHPHGIISCGAFCNFGTEATGFSTKFPGIKPHLLTLRMNFFWPLLRGYYMAAGLCDVSRPSIQHILGRQGGGNAAIIVVGGAQEALDARPGNYCLTLLRRKGFARMALQTGAQLVPCFSFGENDLFRQAANPPGSRVRAFQQLFKGTMGSSPPLFYGRGVFNYTFGLLPFRHEVITVVGSPIAVTKCPEPTAEQVDSLHQEYMARLSDLFDQHKARYGVPEEVKLEFV